MCVDSHLRREKKASNKRYVCIFWVVVNPVQPLVWKRDIDFGRSLFCCSKGSSHFRISVHLHCVCVCAFNEK